MAENPESATTPEQPRPRPSHDVLGRFVVGLLIAAVGLFVLGSAAFVYQESQSKGVPFLSDALSAPGRPLLSLSGVEDSKQLAHQNGPCTSCHSSNDSSGRLYLAINGRDVTDNPSIALRAGDAFDLAFHVGGMARGEKHSGVGVEIIAPRTGWSVGPGTGRQVQDWTESGRGRGFWSPAWNQLGAGGGRTGGRWKPITSQSGGFYVDYSSSSWAVPDIAAAARDDGGQADGDGMRGSMGWDALVSVSLNAEPGRYEIVVAALGYDDRGSATQLSRRIAVQVDPAPSRATKSTKPVRFKAEHGTNRPCGSCHRETEGKLPASHQSLTNKTCTECHTTTISGPPAPAPRVSHTTEGRSDCLSCHRSDGLRPAPADHGGRPNGTCTLCHQSAEAPKGGPSPVPHSLEGRADCASCHNAPLVPAVPADHERRPDEMCVLCHPKGDTSATKGAPEVPHGTTGREQCLACHERGFLRPIPGSHASLGGSSCLSCHKPQPQVSVPGRAPGIPHSTGGRAECLACHGPGGMRPAPADHAGRPVSACAGCHRPDTDRSGAAPKTPHVVEGREECLTCHSSFFIPPVPGDHQGRSNQSCSSCHRGAGRTGD